MVTRIIFWGATGHAKVLRELTERLGYRLVAIFDNNPQVPPPFAGVPIYYGPEGFREWKLENGDLETACLVAIGGAKGRDRMHIQRFLEQNGVKPITAVHPTAFVASSAVLSQGCQVLAHASVCSEAIVGEASIINTASSVDHESVLGRGVHIAPGATLAGCVCVGDYSLVGAGAVVLPRIKIGSNVIVGAGAVVTKDIADGKTVFGNPARIQRENAVPE
jgi:sugar O-acyltransferase (sialic acid O-acetyltransferase NeuD family)